MTDTNTAERESFEAHYRRCSANDATLSRWVDDGSTPPAMVGKYIIRSVQDAWLAFQAGRASLAASAGSEPVTFELPPTPFEPFAQGVEIGYDLWGGADIRLGGEFVYVHINYDYRYTHNAARRSLAEQIAGIIAGTLFTHPSPPEGMAGWKPIETAPKDGTLILVREPRCSGIAVMYLHGWKYESGGICYLEPTHWQPMPAPPLPASEAKEL